MLKAFFRKIASWLKTEAVTIETQVVADAKQAERAIAAAISPVFSASSISVKDVAIGAGWTLSKDGAISFTHSTTEADMNNVNVAIQIALALKANDPSLADAAVQAATNAALAAAYPAPAAAPAA